MRMRFSRRAVIAAIFSAGVVSGCARKEDYAADTAAATIPPADTASVSTTPAGATADTPSRATTSKTTTKSTTTKKAPTKPTY
jgi:hypothetical protein